MSLLKMDLDAPVSPAGRHQIQEMATVLTRENFIESRGVELVAHSPLVRAKETCMQLLGQAATERNVPVLSSLYSVRGTRCHRLTIGRYADRGARSANGENEQGGVAFRLLGTSTRPVLVAPSR